MKWLRDEEMAIKTAERRGERRGEKRGREKGIKEGIKEGEKQKAIAIAKNLLDILDNQTISKKTGLTMEEVEELRGL
ncbi:hypothetical protein AUJ95_09255 [Candidatus Desantisbacteria bacterium CG2_30_40_21]|uniref:Transposase n=4 Tax=unclassified Candidatus Desantisiibacteriota TaxID=3106372 RepID=A0A2M7J9N9_9BACT|nr:MAG: hypothetical protein AUJ95_09255 [Candidatus Desantisbacteria bacterium CG2_30_40_21]PIP39691.1 MAG: hypothetical protein COX18_09330 [Candidatus Desantisbacteria bacterium CG23_combo_of_CG06-09_8_20_14_all_40_23]PIX16114.1 MAG: hypothetical protein COZ71_08535 [Candidatus Desantisbacteria bacterium CG_4_8_14_3_um_filter_40_12]